MPRAIDGAVIDVQAQRQTAAADGLVEDRQKGRGVFCVYVACGQKKSTVAQVVSVLEEHGAMEYTTVVVAEASSLPGLQHLAPFAGCAIAESWMRQGHDVLVIFQFLND